MNKETLSNKSHIFNTLKLIYINGIEYWICQEKTRRTQEIRVARLNTLKEQELCGINEDGESIDGMAYSKRFNNIREALRFIQDVSIEDKIFRSCIMHNRSKIGLPYINLYDKDIWQNFKKGITE